MVVSGILKLITIIKKIINMIIKFVIDTINWIDIFGTNKSNSMNKKKTYEEDEYCKKVIYDEGITLDDVISNIKNITSIISRDDEDSNKYEQQIESNYIVLPENNSDFIYSFDKDNKKHTLLININLFSDKVEKLFPVEFSSPISVTVLNNKKIITFDYKLATMNIKVVPSLYIEMMQNLPKHQWFNNNDYVYTNLRMTDKINKGRQKLNGDQKINNGIIPIQVVTIEDETHRTSIFETSTRAILLKRGYIINKKTNKKHYVYTKELIILTTTLNNIILDGTIIKDNDTLYMVIAHKESKTTHIIILIAIRINSNIQNLVLKYHEL